MSNDTIDKSKIYNNGFAVRALLLLFYPVGVVLLILTKTIKHKIIKGLMYFFLYMTIPFHILMMIILGRNAEKYTNSDLMIAIVIISFLAFLVTLIVYISVIIMERKNKGVIKSNEVTASAGITNSNESPVRTYGEPYVEPQGSFNSFSKAIEKIKENNQSKIEKEYMAAKIDVNKNSVYQKAELLTNREKNFYEVLRLIAEKHNMSVLSKVRLADIVNVGSMFVEKSSEWYERFNRISRKHIDFALAGKDDLSVKLLIEIDDYTHNRQDRKERDEFVDWVCSEAGIPILHVTEISGLETKIKSCLHIE